MNKDDRLELNIFESKLLTSKFRSDNLSEIRKLVSLYCENLELCLYFLNPNQFEFNKVDAVEIHNLTNIYISVINKIIETWNVSKLQDIIGFLDKVNSFNTYFKRYLEDPNEDRFISIERIYDSLIVHASEI